MKREISIFNYLDNKVFSRLTTMHEKKNRTPLVLGSIFKVVNVFIKWQSGRICDLIGSFIEGFISV